MLLLVFAAAVSSADVTSLAVGWRHTCALHSDGAVSCWGANDFGQLGDGTTKQSSVPVRVSGLTDAVELAASANRTCARRHDNTVACWGQLNPKQATMQPGAVAISGVVQLSGPCMRTASTLSCLDRSGTLVPLGITDAIDLAANEEIGCVVRKSGEVACWMDPSDVRPIRGAPGSVSVAVATRFACSLDRAGRTACWDFAMAMPEVTMVPNRHPAAPHQLPVKPVVVPVGANVLAGGTDQVCSIDGGKVMCWQRDRKPKAIKGLTGVTALAVGTHSCAARGKRDVVCWGAARDGALGFGWSEARSVPTKVPGITDAVEIGTSFSPGTGNSQWTCAIRKTGAVMCWGNTSPHNTPGGNATPREMFPHGATLARGMVAGVVDLRQKWYLFNVDGVHQIKTADVLAAEDDCGLAKDGRVLCTYEHRADLSNLHDPNNPDGDAMAIAGLTDVVQISVGGNFGCARRRAGDIACFGERGKLEPVPEITDAIDVAAGTYTACAIRADHSVWCWGQSASEILKGVKAKGHDTRPVAVGVTAAAHITLGADHACVQKLDGGIWCWGDNRYGQLGDGTTTSRAQAAPVSGVADVRQVSAGTDHTCALSRDGTVACWGDAVTGQVGTYVVDEIAEPMAVVW